MAIPRGREGLATLLAEAGFVAADEEAVLLLERARGDDVLLRAIVERRLTGEPLAWILGSTSFCGRTIRVDSGVYVPRWHSEALARRALDRLPPAGVAVDLCTGSGAIAAVLGERRPAARTVATDLDPRAVACAAANGVDARVGDLFAPLPRELAGRVDVVVGVLPYVPTNELELLQRDTLRFEHPRAYDGGEDGLALIRRAVAGSPRWLRPGGALILELGGNQAEELETALAPAGFGTREVIADADGDHRGIEAMLQG